MIGEKMDPAVAISILSQTLNNDGIQEAGEPLEGAPSWTGPRCFKDVRPTQQAKDHCSRPRRTRRVRLKIVHVGPQCNWRRWTGATNGAFGGFRPPKHVLDDGQTKQAGRARIGEIPIFGRGDGRLSLPRYYAAKSSTRRAEPKAPFVFVASAQLPSLDLPSLSIRSVVCVTCRAAQCAQLDLR
jgi:hypothetical protein